MDVSIWLLNNLSYFVFIIFFYGIEVIFDFFFVLIPAIGGMEL